MVALAEAFVRVRPSVDRQEFRRETEKALRGAGGNIKVGLDGSQVRRDLTALASEVGKLRGKDLTINVDVTKAYVDVVTLKEEIQQLGRMRPTVRADADTAQAMAQVQALIAQVERLGGLNPRIRPDVDDSGVRSVGDAAESSSSSISWLAAAGGALAPAIVPSAAAATQAIAGLTSVAIGAAGGLGVTALAAVGVVGALKAMNAADDQATQAGASLTRNQFTQAAATDGLRAARANLANTTANAADSQRRASTSIANALASEADASRALLTAQQALTVARRDASREAEDRNSRLNSVQLDQRQAVIDTADAEERLAAARASAGPTGNSRAVEEAQIALERQRQRTVDLATEQKRLADDKSKADKAGIDGSTQVVSALDRIRQATEQVHKAEQTTAEARAAYTAQARQSAASIAQAQQGIINAQRSVGTATVSAATAGGAAMLKLNQAMADLSPEGQRFTRFLHDTMKPVILDLRRTAEGGLLPGAQAGIEALVTQMPRAIGYTSRYATAVGNLAQKAGETFTQPYWLSFADFLVDKSIPAMTNSAVAAHNMALGVAGLVRASLPLGDDFGRGLIGFSERFAIWANTLDDSRGFQDFLAYVRDVGPDVAATAGAVARAVLSVADAVAPIGGVTLTTIRLLAETINALPTSVLTGLAVGIGGVILVSKGLALVKDLWFSAFGIQFVQMMTNAQIAMALAATQGAGPLGRGLAGARAAAGTLASTIGPAGALGIALAGAAILAVIYAQKSAEQTARVDNLTQALGALGDAYKRTHDLTSQSVQDVVLQSDELSRLTLNASRYGVSVEQIARAASGERDVQHQVVAAFDAKEKALQKTIDTYGKFGGVSGEGQKQAKKELDQLHEDKKALKDRFGELNRNADVTALLTRAQGHLTDETLRLTPAQKSLNDALRVVGDAHASVAEKITAITTAYQAQWKAEMDVTEAQEAAARATDSMTETITRNQTQLALNGGSLDLNTAKNRDQRQAILDSRDAIEAATLASVTRYQADIAGGLPMDQATQRHHDRIAALAQEATNSGANKDAVQLLVQEYGRVPGDVETNIRMNGVKEAFENLRRMKAAQMALEQGISPDEALGRLNRDAYTAQIGALTNRRAEQALGRATGGPIYGPGGPMDDLVPALGPGGTRYQLSDGEWITRARAVDYYGGDTMAAINAMAVPREAMKQLIGRAWGGPVFHGPTQHGGLSHGPGTVWPFVVDVSKTKIPKITAGLGTGGGNIGWSAMWNQLHAVFPWAQLFSAYRPGDMAESGLSYHNYGRAIDVTPDRRIFNWMVSHWGTNLKELIFSPMGDEQIWNGRRHRFTGDALVAAHYNHIHAAMAQGGLVGGLPVRSFDTGGWLPPRSATVAVNGTSQWEPVGPPGRDGAAPVRIEGEVRLDEYSLGRVIQGLLTRPNRVVIEGPNELGLSVPGWTP